MISELLFRSVLLGAGLAMDAFSVSLADGLNEPEMPGRRAMGIAGTFAGFQFAMPLAGWVLVRTAVRIFTKLELFIPWIALILLLYIGGKMLIEGIRENRSRAADAERAVTAQNNTGQAQSNADPAHNNAEIPDSAGISDMADVSDIEAHAADRKLGAGELVVQGIATSIDALSVGFAIETYSAAEALASSVIIGVVTLAICLTGLAIGKKAGTRLAGKAAILGGIILIFIGIEIWLGGIN